MAFDAVKAVDAAEVQRTLKLFFVEDVVDGCEKKGQVGPLPLVEVENPATDI